MTSSSPPLRPCQHLCTGLIPVPGSVHRAAEALSSQICWSCAPNMAEESDISTRAPALESVSRKFLSLRLLLVLLPHTGQALLPHMQSCKSIIRILPDSISHHLLLCSYSRCLTNVLQHPHSKPQGMSLSGRSNSSQEQICPLVSHVPPPLFFVKTHRKKIVNIWGMLPRT